MLVQNVEMQSVDVDSTVACLQEPAGSAKFFHHEIADGRYQAYVAGRQYVFGISSRNQQRRKQVNLSFGHLGCKYTEKIS